MTAILGPPDMSLIKGDYICPECGKICKGMSWYFRHMNYYHNDTKPLKKGKRTNRAPLSSELLNAMEAAGAGIMRAARELGVGRQYFIKWAEILIPEEFAEYRNRVIKGTRLRKGSVELTLKKSYVKAMAILDGTAPVPEEWAHNSQRRMRKLVEYGLLPTGCQLCGFSEVRITDYKSPQLLEFIDGDKHNWKLDNLRVLCYNCYYLNVHDIWGKSKTAAFK